jgi:ankyrin repeat protein
MNMNMNMNMTMNKNSKSKSKNMNSKNRNRKDKNNNTNSILKPTEAQLRYAQFHHKRRSQAVKHRIDRLHQTPLKVLITIGKVVGTAVQQPTNGDCDDGYCSSVATEETSDVEVKAVRLRRPKISAGRRAFLKDSKRSYRRRRKDIGQHGYRGYFIDDDVDDGVDEAQQGEDTEGDFGSDTDDHEHDHEQREAGGDGNGDGHTADAAVLNEVFATLPKQHQIRRRERRKRRGKPSTGSRGESYRNFQAACHAMMWNIQTSQTKASLPSIKMADPSKRWRRSEAHVAAAEAHYKTFAGRRKASANKNAALLLSYKYYQQQKSQSKGNNNNNGFMDKGASWLTHLPAKQSKRSRRGDTYYFHDMNELPHLIQQAANDAKDHDNDDNYSADGNDSSSTLAMRKPGPQKFHRLMAYVQHKLIEKEKQNEQQTTQQHLLLLDGDQTRRNTGPGQSRTRQLAEIIEQPSTPQTITPSKIKQMADSIEGISSNATPTMKLKNQANTPFSGLTASPFSPTPGGSFRKRRGKSRYVPRMRLREFVVEGNDGDEEGGDSNGDGNGNGNGDVATPLPRKKLSERFLDDGEKGDEDINDASLPPTPKMRLRDSMLGQESQTTQAGSASNVNMSTDRTKEMALAFEGEANDIDENSKFQQIRKSLEPDSTPKMKLKGEDRNHGTGEFTSSSSSLLPPAPKMRLRDSILGLESQATPGGSASNTDGRMSTERTREMALAFEGDETNDIEESNSKFQQIRKSLEPPKDGTPKMKLKGDFDRIDEPKAGDKDNNNNNASNVSRSSVDRLSKQFAQRSPQAEELMADFNRPSHDVVQEFSKHIDPRIYEQFEQMGLDVQQQTKKPRASSGSSSSNNRKSEGSGHDNDKRQSTGSNVTEFFARIRGEQIQQRQQEIGQDQQQGSSNDSSSHPNRPLESLAYPPASPGGHSDAISDLSKGSTNVSGFWNRGRSSISNLTSKTLNTIAENNQTATHLKGKVGLLSPELLGRATNGLFNKFRGVPEDSVDVSSVPFPSTLEQQQQYQAQTYQPTITEAVSNLTQEQQQKEGEQQQQGQQQPDLMLPHPLVKTMSVDSHDALRNYHKTRASMSPEAMDSMSESIKQMNSGKPLPDQIREVVQNSGGTKKSLPSSSAATTMKEGANRDRSSVATQSTLSPSELSTEQYKRAHGRFLENSDLLGNEYMQENIIDTDDTQSIASDAHAGMDPQALARMMMSPDILQKRLKQAVGSVEKRKWEQVLFLINANPWLAEMKELTTNQYLLHKLAFFGTGTPPAPMSLSEQLVKKFPAAVHKFDQDGNVPLHLASAAGNVDMIKMLGEKFSSGASIRNEDGMLPLHFAIASFAIDFDGNNEDRNSSSQPLEAIKTVLKLFPQAVAIADNDGNLPLHVASECLRGGVGVDVVYLLMDEAERQLEDPYGARFRNKMKLEQMLEDEDEKSQDTMSRNAADDSSMMDTELHCTMVLNDFGETPLLAAIRSGKGWEMIEALVTGPGGRKAALEQDSDKNNALHLLVGEFQNATAAMVRT